MSSYRATKSRDGPRRLPNEAAISNLGNQNKIIDDTTPPRPQIQQVIISEEFEHKEQSQASVKNLNSEK